jgi:hypothetical protein
MTLICVKDNIMCADGGAWQGIVSLPTAGAKIEHLKDGSLIAMCGRTSDRVRVREWADANFCEPRPALHEETDFLLLRPDGRCFIGDKDGLGCELSTPAAIGKPYEFALGVMIGGGSAERAVELACQHTDGARGPIQVERLHP